MIYNKKFISVFFVLSIIAIGNVSYIKHDDGIERLNLDNTFEYYKNYYHNTTNFTIINMDPTLSEEDIINCVHDCYISTFLDVYYIDGTNWNDYVIDYNGMDVDYTNYMFQKSVKKIPVGNRNFTIVVINQNHESIKNTLPLWGGHTLDERAYVIHYNKDDSVDLGIRILHELCHTMHLDADGMYTTNKDAFKNWMVSSGYPFKNFYEKPYIYIGNENYYNKNGGKQILLDYHIWLILKNSKII